MYCRLLELCCLCGSEVLILQQRNKVLCHFPNIKELQQIYVERSVIWPLSFYYQGQTRPSPDSDAPVNTEMCDAGLLRGTPSDKVWGFPQWARLAPTEAGIEIIRLIGSMRMWMNHH
ncbi:hypothetical protein ILYODFUR_022664 [Ilyodon furcidens]|uniref:Uncharacterized protein n=1 Tax=Ilyodon furcidens TaxID=33524 RepID=A0ABV0TMQ2_9TELE